MFLRYQWAKTIRPRWAIWQMLPPPPSPTTYTSTPPPPTSTKFHHQPHVHDHVSISSSACHVLDLDARGEATAPANNAPQGPTVDHRHNCDRHQRAPMKVVSFFLFLLYRALADVYPTCPFLVGARKNCNQVPYKPMPRGLYFDHDLHGTACGARWNTNDGRVAEHSYPRQGTPCPVKFEPRNFGRCRRCWLLIFAPVDCGARFAWNGVVIFLKRRPGCLFSWAWFRVVF